MVSIKQLQKSIHKTAVEHGWWDFPIRTPLEIHALIHSEVSEATEEVRNRSADYYFDFDKKGKQKLCGEAVEMADIIIRVLDYAEHRGWNMEEFIKEKCKYNMKREYRHGGKSA